jgi:hypothetical protein
MRHFVCVDMGLFESYFSAFYLAQAAVDLFPCKGLN